MTNQTPEQRDVEAVAQTLQDLYFARGAVVDINSWNTTKGLLTGLLTNQHTQHTKELANMEKEAYEAGVRDHMEESAIELKEVVEEILKYPQTVTVDYGTYKGTQQVFYRENIKAIALARGIKLD